MPGKNWGMVRATRRRSEWEKVWSFPEATSRSRAMVMRFSAATARMPEGTAPGTPMQEMEPFCSPWTPAPRVTMMHRASR